MKLRSVTGTSHSQVLVPVADKASMTDMDTRWARLSRAVDAERKRQRLSWARLAKSAGMSARTLYDLRTAERTSYQPETLDRLELALQWEPGSVERVLAGRAPLRKADPDMSRIQQAWPDLPPSVRRVLADVAQFYRP